MSFYLVVYLIGGWVRYILSQWTFFEDRPEISNPVNAWKRMAEGIHLYGLGKSPYDGVIFHESPIFLVVFSFLKSVCHDHSAILFILGDLLTCYVLTRLGRTVGGLMLTEQKGAKWAYHPEAQSLLIPPNYDVTLPKNLALCFLFNPFLMMNCAAKTSTVWSNLLLAIALYGQVEKRRWLACAALSMATYQSLYPIVLIFPLCIQLARDEGGVMNRAGLLSIIRTLTTFMLCLGCLLALSWQMMGSWQFVGANYGFILSVPELTPNMGIFWYFFTEMFEHFRTFFLATFQLNLMMYCLPLSIRFSQQPLLLSVLLTGLVAVFKSYPSVGDLGFFIALVPCFAYLLPFLRQTFVICGMLTSTTVLAPIVWQLWIYNNSANANYYFAINLVYSSAQIFLITDLLFAHVKRDFYLKNGFTEIDKEIQKKKLALQLK